ncbi:MAG: prepilin-type N-terminal cleavage/methylation domain-containing protein [bacterium]
MRKSAFTLIELLTAMAILVIIVMIALKIFLQSSTVWNVSSTRARINMLGRAAVDYVSQKHAVTTDAATVTIGVLGVASPTTIMESGLTPSRTLSVKVTLTLPVNDPLRAIGAVRVRSGGADKVLNTGDDINSWN